MRRYQASATTTTVALLVIVGCARQYDDFGGPSGETKADAGKELLVPDGLTKDNYQSSPSAAPSGPPVGTKKVVRGGSFSQQGPEIRSSDRAAHTPSFSGPGIGIRCCGTL